METVVIKKGDPNYPKCLLDLSQPPEQLYCRGRLELLTRPAVAIVGTRDCTRYGVSVAREIAKKCVENGIAVISGGAAGIDTAAHSGAMEALSEMSGRNGGVNMSAAGTVSPTGSMPADTNSLRGAASFAGAVSPVGKVSLAGTISVLGNGLNHCYPTENWELQKQIESEGLLISEYPDDFPANKQTFPQRNRIVAGLSNAVLVVEADFKSGTMITVRVAKKIKREVFAVPGSIKSYASNGANDLIKSKTAKMLTGFDDILQFFRMQTGENKTDIKPVLQLSFEEKNILDIIRKDEVHLDELLEKCKMPTHALMTLLTDMELSGLIEKLPANYIVAK
jgi:DNA processing protein